MYSIGDFKIGVSRRRNVSHRKAKTTATSINIELHTAHRSVVRFFHSFRIIALLLLTLSSIIHFGELCRIPQNEEHTEWRSVGTELSSLRRFLNTCVIRRKAATQSVEQSTQLGIPDAFPGIQNSVAMRNNPSHQCLAVGVVSHGGRVDISGDSALSRGMEEGIPRFPLQSRVFGIFNRTHGNPSAERITRAVSDSPMPFAMCSFCRK